MRRGREVRNATLKLAKTADAPARFVIVASARLQSTGRGSALGGLWFPERSLHVEVPLPGDRSNLDNPTGLAVVHYVDVPSLELLDYLSFSDQNMVPAPEQPIPSPRVLPPTTTVRPPVSTDECAHRRWHRVNRHGYSF